MSKRDFPRSIPVKSRLPSFLNPWVSVSSRLAKDISVTP